MIPAKVLLRLRSTYIIAMGSFIKLKGKPDWDLAVNFMCKLDSRYTRSSLVVLND